VARDVLGDRANEAAPLVVATVKRFLLVLLLGCASSPAVSPLQVPPADNDTWHLARVTEAHVNGCKEDCPPATDDRCVDAYGLCWTRCAWKQAGTDQHFRELLERAAFEADPTSSFLVTCPDIKGSTEARR
jgi:hypothetical protein